jgi:hypothetical protein
MKFSLPNIPKPVMIAIKGLPVRIASQSSGRNIPMASNVGTMAKKILVSRSCDDDITDDTRNE